MSISTRLIKQTLETAFDIPFDVYSSGNTFDPRVTIIPSNDEEAFFELIFSFKQQTRMIVEMIPQRYSAPMIQNMASASLEKKAFFACYARMLLEKYAMRMQLTINHHQFDPLVPTGWPEEWSEFHCRISKSPILEEDTLFDADKLIGTWAVPVAGMFLSLLDIVPAVLDQEGVTEGRKLENHSTRYERSPINRQLCLSYHGCTCCVCGFDFEKEYGSIGKGFIHVHHLLPVSQMGIASVISPQTDLVPVCPNCHAMLHKKDPPFTPAELIAILLKQRSTTKSSFDPFTQ